MFKYYRFLSMFLPLAPRAQPNTPYSLLNLIINHSSFPKIFFPGAALNGLVKKNRFFRKNIGFFNFSRKLKRFQTQQFYIKMIALSRATTMLSFKEKFFSRFRHYL